MGLNTRWIVLVACVAAVAGLVANLPSDSQAPSPLLRAAYQGDLPLVQQLLPVRDASLTDAAFKEHVRVQANVKDQWNNTALHWAAKGGTSNSLAIVQHLISAGTDVFALNNGGSTALHWSCTVPNAAVSVGLIRLFLSHGVSVDATNRAGETPLHWAVDFARTHAVDQLLISGATPSAKDHEGNTPMHKIKSDCHDKEDCTAVVTRLLRGGADAGLKNNFGRTPLQYFNQDSEQALKAPSATEQPTQPPPTHDAEREHTSDDDGDDVKPPLTRQSALTPSQIESIQKEFEAFRKNMTEGTDDEEDSQPEYADQAAAAE